MIYKGFEPLGDREFAIMAVRISVFMVLLLPLVVPSKLSDGVDYNKLVKWEKRTLICEGRRCTISVKDGAERPAKCADRMDKELSEDVLFDCDIECNGADRDSVIQKFPNNNHKCIRFYSYNTEKNRNGWSMWRSGVCAGEKITLTVHCGFPE